MNTYRVMLEQTTPGAMHTTRKLPIIVAGSAEDAMRIAEMLNPEWRAFSVARLFAGSPAD